MKINCTRERVDTNKILYGIDTFRMEHCGDKPSYIIMNYETREDILDYYYFDSRIKGLTGLSVTKEDRLFDIPVVYSEGLKYGEVDII